MSRDSHTPRFDRMFELPVASFLGNLLPSILFHYADFGHLQLKVSNSEASKTKYCSLITFLLRFALRLHYGVVAHRVEMAGFQMDGRASLEEHAAGFTVRGERIFVSCI